MGVRIYTNIDAMNADRHLGITSINLSKSIQRLSSGLRINSAADDAAGLGISERLRAQVRGNNQAVRNTQDGISLFQTAEGALDEVHSILQRMRELNVQAANGTVSTTDRASISAENTELANALERIATTSQFNSMILMGGGFNTLTLQIGANADDGVAATYTTTVAMADMRISGGAFGTGLPPGFPAPVNMATFQTGTIATVTEANQNLSTIDAAINVVSSFRGLLGARQNMLEHVVASLNVASENQAAAESRIRDLDVANETVNFTKLQILQQAGTAVLAQANTSPQTVLQLLK
ncbi:MAG TPA: flagellin [Chloroflexota bacterium]|jgi:flagellin|nr:flagellin [Chloroflexota bacterium]